MPSEAAAWWKATVLVGYPWRTTPAISSSTTGLSLDASIQQRPLTCLQDSLPTVKTRYSPPSIQGSVNAFRSLVPSQWYIQGPPGTGKMHTSVQMIEGKLVCDENLEQNGQLRQDTQIFVTAPSNADVNNISADFHRQFPGGCLSVIDEGVGRFAATKPYEQALGLDPNQNPRLIRYGELNGGCDGFRFISINHDCQGEVSFALRVVEKHRVINWPGIGWYHSESQSFHNSVRSWWYTDLQIHTYSIHSQSSHTTMAFTGRILCKIRVWELDVTWNWI